METVTIKIKDSKVLKLLQSLEELNLIQMVAPKTKKTMPKLSAMLSGSITDEQAKLMHEEVRKMRNEWEQDTY